MSVWGSVERMNGGRDKIHTPRPLSFFGVLRAVNRIGRITYKNALRRFSNNTQETI